MLIGLVAISMASDLNVTRVAAMFVGVGFSFPWTAVIAGLMRETPQEQRGAVIGFLSTIVDIFVAVGAVAGGVISDRNGYAAAFWMAAICAGLSAGVGFFFFSHIGKRVKA